jgi:predicted NAD/FAD-binding protein
VPEVHPSERRPTAAVVGSGVAGLTAAHLLQKRYDVTLFEGDGRLGGHAHTHDVATPDDRLLAIDSGFIVHNERTYPMRARSTRRSSGCGSSTWPVARPGSASGTSA